MQENQGHEVHTHNKENSTIIRTEELGFNIDHISYDLQSSIELITSSTNFDSPDDMDRVHVLDTMHAAMFAFREMSTLTDNSSVC